MADVRLAKEIFFRTPTRVGLLADVTETLADAGVNISGIGAYDKDGMGEFLLITNDDATAIAALAALGGEITETEVVVAHLEDTPGTLAKTARKIADAGINIKQVHATTAGGAHAMVVFRTEDDAEVVRLLGAS
jgi:hypothetical protein